MTPLRLPVAVARRFLVLRHLLAPPRSLPPAEASVGQVFERLGSIQFDPLEVAGRNHDLVLLARVGGYRRGLTDTLLYERRQLFEAYNKGLSLLPTSELPWHRVTWDRARVRHEGGAFDEHAPLVEELLERIRTHGPLSPTDIEPRAAIDWYWRPTNQVRAVLEALAEAGILGIARREGNRRVYDLAERLLPATVLAQRPPVRDQFRHRLLSRYRAHGLLGATGSAELWYGTSPSTALGVEDGVPLQTPGRRALHAELVERGELLPVEVEGLRGLRYIVAEDRGWLEQAEREVSAEATSGGPAAPGGATAGVTFLAPLDPLMWDRDLARRLFGFDYVWEVYVPEAKRRWGYYVLPLLYGDRLVGRIEPRIDRRTGTLRVLGLWWEDGFDPLDGEAHPGFIAAVADAVQAHMAFGGMERVTWPRVVRHRSFVRAVQAALSTGVGSR